ncbi:MAG: SAM-dependent methyltransferase [Myxococcales bacterium]|nr:SAM-dependent methyltransferase [Myxococcales bacterium]
MNSLENLSRCVAAARARENGRPDRLLDDPLASVLAGDGGATLLGELDALHPAGLEAIALVNPLAIRARFFDDFATAALADFPPLRQVVLLAPGMDTRAFRVAWPEGTRLFEVEDPALLATKQALLDRANAHPTCTRIPVGADLSGAFAATLREAGFDSASPSLWLLEGLLIHLGRERVHHVLHLIAGLAAPGSRLGADVLGEQTLAMPPLRPVIERMAHLGTPWRFGSDAPEDLFALYGWSASALQSGDAAVQYGRTDEEMPPRTLQGIPREYLVTARRMG